MNACTLFSKPIRADATNSPTIKLSFLQQLLDPFSAEDSGIWKPIVIKTANNKAEYCEPFVQAGLSKINKFDPCNCNSDQVVSEGDSFYNDTKTANLTCDYCGTYTATWKLYDTQENNSQDILGNNGVFSANCCGGACDVRFKNDDFLPKLPLLNQTYLSGFYDFKHLDTKFPACSNPGLGVEDFISFNQFSDLTISNAKFCIDWKLKERMGEIEYDPFTSYHLNEYTHTKSKSKNDLVSRTCGNFLLLSVSNTGYKNAYNSIFSGVGTSYDIPSTGDFTIPYGFDNATHNNLFIGGKKIASHWKWTYSSGILGWYRYYDTNRSNDQRPIHGIDLYISDGDVFWAQTDGPELTNSDYFDRSFDSTGSTIKECPSGLKIVEGSTFKGIVPTGSECLYISNNIYPTFYSFYEKYIILGETHAESMRLAAIMSTSPMYDGYTVDLLHPDGPELYNRFNNYKQIYSLNKDMLVGTTYGSSRGLNYIQNNEDLVNTLYYKYGGYIWIPPNTNASISLNLGSTAKSIYIDLDFDMNVNQKDIIKKFKTKFVNNSTVSPEVNSCSSLAGTTSKNFSYEQTITAGTAVVSTNISDNYRHQQSCSSGNLNNFDFALYANLLLNNVVFNSVPAYSGAYILTDTYPRITTSDSAGFLASCNNCGANSSFYLVNNAESLCVPPTVNQIRDDSKTFCYSVLSNFLNNSEGVDPATNQQRPDGTRPLRTIVDGTFYDYRRYKALAFNPHIDLVAFHEHGGIYFNSASFGATNAIVFDKNVTNNNASNIDINFKTNDVGIKLYSLYIEKLQSSDQDSYICKRFPVDLDNICKCYGLNLSQYGNRTSVCNTNNNTYRSSSLYVPSLSTHNSPNIQYYGGYTVAEVKDLFGLVVTQQTPGNLPNIDLKLDPENPYSCDKSYTISLLNYSSRSYDMNLQNFSTDHADIFVTVNEAIDYLGLAATPVEDDYGDVSYTTNYNWKRFLNRVEINELTLYNKQKKLLYEAGSSIGNISIKVTNPFLEKIVGQQELALPTGDQCSVSAGANLIINGVRGDELSTVNLTFLQKPRQQLLTFTLNSNTSNISTINFSKGYFIPHKGLYNAADHDPLDGLSSAIDGDGKIRYDNILNALNSPNDSSVWEKQNLIYGKLNNDSINILNSIDTFDIHKKPRLYIKHNSKWYTAKLSNRGGFLRDDKTYIGYPKFFEYLRNPLYSKKIGCVIPAVPKKSVDLKINYYDHWQKAKVIDPYTLRVEGSLAYTMLKEEPIIVESTNPDIISHVANNQNANIEPNTLIQITNGNKKDYFIYIGIATSDIKNYLYIGQDPNILNLKSNLEIDYENISSNGYVYDTYKKCDSYIFYYNTTLNSSNTQNSLQPVDNSTMAQIVAKKLIVKLYNDQNETVTGDYTGRKKVKIFTELTLKTVVHAEVGESVNVDFGTNNYVWDEIKSTDKDVLLANNVYNTKWGDLVKYDGFLLNNPYIIDYKSNIAPPTAYENLLYKQILNDYNNSYIFGTKDPNSPNAPINIKTLSNPRFFLLQKYNYITEQAWDIDFRQFENYIPILFFDHNTLLKSNTIFDRYLSMDLNPPWRNKRQSDLNFYSSVLVNIYDKALDIQGLNPDSDDLLIVTNLEEFESAFVPDPTRNFHTETLRLDDPIFWLDRTIKEDKSVAIDNSRTLFKPTNMDSYINSIRPDSHFITETIKRSNPFYRQTVYADMDNPDKCGQQPQYSTQTTKATCIFRSAGSIDLTSQFAIGKPKTVEFDNLEDDIEGYISYDAGLYNVVGNNNYITITRTELPANNPIINNIDCSSTSPLPSYKSRIFLSSYQDFIENNRNNIQHSTNVQNMDIHANEMLFRILYGEKQVINRKQLFIDKQPLSKNDLLNYSDPEIKPRSIYDEILYNYDKNSSANLTVNGSLTVKGTKEIGDGIVIDIGDVNITLSMVFDTNTNSLLLEGNIGNKTVSTTLYQGIYKQKGLISQQYFTDDGAVPAAPEPSGPQETIELVATTTGKTDDTIASVPIATPDDSLTTVGVGMDWIRVFRNAQDNPPCHPGTQPNDPFNFGYCRVDDTQEGCDKCDKFEDIDYPFGSPNFTYEFEDCSYKFRLYGHSYRYHYAISDNRPVIDDPGDSPDPNSGGLHGNDPRSIQNQNYPPPGTDCPLTEPLNVMVGCMPATCYGAKSPPGCDGISIQPGREAVRKVYVKTTTRNVPSYEPSLCPVDILTINYNSDEITMTVPSARATLDQFGAVVQSITNKNYCVPLNINNNCPEIFVSFSNNKYSVSENIASSCNANCENNADILIDSKRVNYTTRDYTAVCVVGTFSYANVNGGDRHIVYTAFRPGDCCDDFGRCLPPCYCNNGYLLTLCDGSGAPWKVCQNPKVLSWGGNHHNYWGFNLGGKVTIVECDPFDFSLSAHGPTAATQAQIYENSIKRQFERTYGSSSSIGAYSGAMHECQVQPEISNTDIFEGVIPGSCTLHKYVSSRDVTKAQARADGGVIFENMTITYEVHYIKYKYRTTATSQSAQLDVLDPDTSDDIIEIAPTPYVAPTVKTNNPITPCRFNAFPDSYKVINYSYFGYASFVSLPNTYIRTSPYYNKGACESSIACYNTLAGTAEKQTICDNRDWICWSVQDSRNSYNFLSRLNNEIWQ
jgi:hypothetical protein